MKKSFVILTSLIFAALLFAGCQDVIFAKIMGEVELEDGEINGHINSIVRYKAGGTEMLYTSNGIVYAKDASNQSHGAWNKRMSGIPTLSYSYYDRKFDGVYVSHLAADKDNLYALTDEIVENTDKGENYFGTRWLYKSTDGYSWTPMENVGDKDSRTVIFCTNTIKNENRKAYIRYGGSVYDLSSTWSTSSLGSPCNDGAGANTVSAVRFKNGGSPPDKTYFFDTASATNEKNNGGTVVDATKIYKASGSTLQYSTDGTNWIPASGNAEATILSIAVTSSAIILGTDGNGLNKVAASSNGTPSGSITDNFSTNADTALESPYRIFALLCIDPAQSETGASIYAAVDFTGSSSSSGGSYRDIGLWSYYPGRGNWNRE